MYGVCIHTLQWCSIQSQQYTWFWKVICQIVRVMLYASGNALYVLSGQLFMFWELHVKIMLLSGLACRLVHLCINCGKIRIIGTCLKQNDRTVIVSFSSMVNKYIHRRLAEDISLSFPGEISLHDYDITGAICHYCLKTWRLRQNGHHFADDISKWIFFNENIWISNFNGDCS